MGAVSFKRLYRAPFSGSLRTLTGPLHRGVYDKIIAAKGLEPSTSEL
jgi:hypothetical protein